MSKTTTALTVRYGRPILLVALAATLLGILSLGTVSSLKAAAVTLAEEWVATYAENPIMRNWASAVAVDDSGNVYVTGTSDRDFATLKYDSAGTELWVATWNGGYGWDQATDIAVDDLGNVFVTGHIDGGGTGIDYNTIKYDPNGTILWRRTYNGGVTDPDDYAQALALDNLGNVYVTGSSYASETGRDFVTVKYLADGTRDWVATYDGGANLDDYAVDIAVDGSLNTYVTGYSYVSSSDSKYVTINYGPTGNQAWVATYDGATNELDTASAIVVNATGVYVTGASGTGMSRDYATVKYAFNASQLWTARYDNVGGGDAATAIAVDDLGNVYVTGSSGTLDPGTPVDYATIKYAADGSELWVATYDGPGPGADIAAAIALDDSGNVYVTGSSHDGEPAEDSYTTIQYSPDGTEMWVGKYNGVLDEDDEATAMAVDPLGNVYVTGAGSDGGYATVKYGPDSDGDGLADKREEAGWEIAIYDCEGNVDHWIAVTSDPYDVDTDDDGLSDLEEWEGWHVGYTTEIEGEPTWVEFDVMSDPNFPDADGDGVPDSAEKDAGTDPHEINTDCDGAWDTNDGFEIEYGLDPLDFDTDTDGVGDGLEIDLWIEAAGFDPANPNLVPLNVLLLAVNNTTNGSLIPASIDIDPDILNVRKKAPFITCYIELPGAYQAEDIDASKILLAGEIPALINPKYDFATDPNEYLVDLDEDGILERMVKFDRSEVFEYLNGRTGQIILIVTGEVSTTTFLGTDTIRVK